MKVWHYTTADRAMHIMTLGMLMPATAYIDPRERPVVWFSARQDFEPTAVKMMRKHDGTLRSATLEEMFQYGVGLHRFGVDSSLLLNGEFLRRAARISPSTWTGLSRVARAQGASPRDWYGHIGEISIDRMCVEYRATPDGPWLAYEREEVSA